MKREQSKWKYTLLVSDGAYFSQSLWGLFTEVLTHRLHHWKRGDGWRD